jgi:hypothetical protein
MVAEILPNGFRLMDCEWRGDKTILPGHYVVIENDNDNPVHLPIFDVKPGFISLLIPPSIVLPIASHSSETLFSFSDISGDPLAPPGDEPLLLLLEDFSFGVGIFYLKKYRRQFTGAVLIGTQTGFAFHPCPSRMITPHLPNELIAASPLLEDWGILNRLANINDQPGCFEGTVQELAQIWQAEYPVMWAVMDLTRGPRWASSV